MNVATANGTRVAALAKALLRGGFSNVDELTLQLSDPGFSRELAKSLESLSQKPKKRLGTTVHRKVVIGKRWIESISETDSRRASTLLQVSELLADEKRFPMPVLRGYIHAVGFPHLGKSSRSQAVMAILKALGKLPQIEIEKQAHALSSDTVPGTDSRGLEGWAEIIHSRRKAG